ncbi:ATP-binding protein [Roseococcus sp. YIM B11640]|uniref:ATP-binding protein n=1 Tax=Roseococcus sp. YIM B11640 TaxID=3133973 RepID=UPI003C7ABFF1
MTHQAAFARAERPLWTLTMQATEAPAPAAGTPDELALRLLRHHTKNTLQRILSEIVLLDGSRLSLEGGRLLRDLEKRIMLSAAISDALFGMTGAPRPMADRLRALAKAGADLLSDPDQIVRIDVTVDGECPSHLRETVMRASHEMIGNAVKHGLHERMLGRIRLHLASTHRETRLTVEDDGWGFAGVHDGGEGLGLAQALAEQHGGRSSIARIAGGTRAEMVLPHRPGASLA